MRIAPQPERPWVLNQEQVALLKNYLHMGSASEVDLKGCLEVAQRYRLDPFKPGQIWFIKRWDTNADNGKGGLGTHVWTPQIGVYGMAHIAARDHSDYGALSRPEYGPEIEIARDGHKIKGPQWCIVHAHKKGMSEPSVGEVFFEEICPQKWDNCRLFWAVMPHRMIAKCAKAQALREAYPDLGGLYIPEEMGRFRDEVTAEGRQITYEERSTETPQQVVQRIIEEKKAAIERAEQTPGTAAYAQAHKEPEQVANSKAKENLPEKKQEPPAPVQAKKLAFVKTMPDHDLAASGYLADEKMQQFLADISAVRFKSQKDGGIYWRFSPQYLDDFKKLCERLGIEVS